MGDPVDGKRILTDQPSSWSAFDSLVSASRSTFDRPTTERHRNASATSQTSVNRTAVDPRSSILLSRILSMINAEAVPILQFVHCTSNMISRSVALATAQTSALLLGRTLYVDATLSPREPETASEAVGANMASNIFPDAFTPRLYCHRLADGSTGNGLLFGNARQDALQRLAAPFSFVVIDSLGPTVAASASAFASICAGNIVVVTAGITSRALILETISGLKNAGGKVIGTILDNAPGHLPKWMNE